MDIGGFKNLGNTCYMNSVASMLIHCESFSKSVNCSSNSCVLCSLKACKPMLCSGQAVAPNEAVKRMKVTMPSLRFGQQQDAHEFLMNLLNEDCSINQLCRHMHVTTTLCMACGVGGTREETMFDLPLAIQGENIQDLLDGYQKEECVSEYLCHSCSELTSCTRQLRVMGAPKVLLVTLKRFNNQGKKVAQSIQFLSDIKINNSIYQLRGFVVHRGSRLRTGHYVAFAYHTGFDTWLEFDDSEVNAVDQTKIGCEKPYILLFERKESPKTQGDTCTTSEEAQVCDREAEAGGNSNSTQKTAEAGGNRTRTREAFDDDVVCLDDRTFPAVRSFKQDVISGGMDIDLYSAPTDVSDLSSISDISDVNPSPRSVSKDDCIDLTLNSDTESVTEVAEMYLNDDPATPIYQASAITDRMSQVEILYNSSQGANREKVCSTVPYRCVSNSSFIIDVARLDSAKDLAADGLPTWLNRSNKDFRFAIGKDGRIKECDTGPLLFRTTYYAQKSNTKITRRIMRLTHSSGDMAMICYMFNGEKIVEQPHGNSKKSDVYARTRPSLLDKGRMGIERNIAPREIIQQNMNNNNLLTITDASGEFKSSTQIYNLKHSVQDKLWVDELLWAINDQKDRECSPIANICMTGKCQLAITLATDTQIHLMEQFCTGESAGILGIDMTYNIGQYFVTPTTVRHPLLIHTITKVEPTLLGPTLIHTEHNEHSYRYFASSIVNLNPKLKYIRFLGSDRALETVNGFKIHMPLLQHMVCFKHLKDNVESYLKSKLCDAEYNKVHYDVFTTLLDSNTETEFEEVLEALLSSWNSINPDITKWFIRYQAKSFKSLVRENRRAAGLNDNFFYNNSNESVNKELKRNLTRKSSLKDIIEEWEKQGINQKNNCERAVLSMGLFRLKSKYSRMTYNAQEFFKLSVEKRKKILATVFKYPTMPSDGHTETLTQTVTKNCNKRVGRKLNENQRKRKKTSHASQFCAFETKHKSHVFFRFSTACHAKKCYVCDELFKRERDELLGVVMTYRKYREKDTGVITISKTPQNAYCHLKCLGGREDFKKPYHMCNYLNISVSLAHLAEIEKHGRLTD